HRLGHRPYRPSRAILWRTRRAHDDLLAYLRRNPRFAAPALRVAQTRDAGLPKALLPLHDNRLAHSNFPCRLGLAQTISPVEDNPSSPVVPMGSRRAITMARNARRCSELMLNVRIGRAMDWHYIATTYIISSQLRDTTLESMHALSLEELRKPEITFWSVWSDTELLGCGALKELDPQHG